MHIFESLLTMAAPQLAGYFPLSLRWRHNERDGVSNPQPHDCLLNRLFRRKSQKPSKLRVTGLCEGNSPLTGEFPAQRASNAENVSIWWRHHAVIWFGCTTGRWWDYLGICPLPEKKSLLYKTSCWWIEFFHLWQKFASMEELTNKWENPLIS